MGTAMSTVGAGTKGGEDDQDNGRDQKRVLARPMVAQVAKCELTNYCSGECDGRDVALRTGLCVFGTVDGQEHGVDRTNNLQRRLRQYMDEAVEKGGHALHSDSRQRRDHTRQRGRASSVPILSLAQRRGGPHGFRPHDPQDQADNCL